MDYSQELKDKERTIDFILKEIQESHGFSKSVDELIRDMEAEETLLNIGSEELYNFLVRNTQRPFNIKRDKFQTHFALVENGLRSEHPSPPPAPASAPRQNRYHSSSGRPYTAQEMRDRGLLPNDSCSVCVASGFRHLKTRGTRGRGSALTHYLKVNRR